MTGRSIAAALGEKLTRGVSRRLARNVPFRPHGLSLDRAIVSFSFDDFPVSAAENAAPVLEDAGMRGTFYFAGGLAGGLENGQPIATPEMARDLALRGHEIGAHTHGHLNVQKAGRAALLSDVERNVQEIAALGTHGAPASFAYPFGIVSLRSKLALMGRFAGLRGIQPGINSGTIDLAHLRAQELYDVSSTLDDMGRLLDEVEAARGWLIFYTHDVRPDPSSIGCTPGYFRRVADLVRRRGLRVETVAATLQRIGAKAADQPALARIERAGAGVGPSSR